jgi:hypothetical protein
MASDVMKLWESEDTGSHFTTLSFSQIKNATDNFSTENKLGEGGFGPVTRLIVLFSFRYYYMVHQFLNMNLPRCIYSVPTEFRESLAID